MATKLGQDYRVALITGAGSGLGRELARQLAGQGVAIAAIDKQEDGLRSLEGELKAKGQSIACAQADVTDASSLLARTQELEGLLGPVDLLIASAGIGLETSALSLNPETMASVIGVNLIGVSHSISAVLPGMLRRRKGHVVALSSVASFRGMPRMLGYCASKAGVNALMDGLRVEVEGQGVWTTTICPGWVRTPMTANLDAPMQYLMNVDYAAEQILWAIRKKKAFYAFPRRLVWRLKILTWLPRSLQDRMIRNMLRRELKGP